MHRELIARWNSVVPKDGVIIHLGDFSLTKREDFLNEILSQLNGKKALLAGNHDHWLKHESLRSHFFHISSYEEVDIKGRQVSLMHEPLLSWPGMHRGSWCLHGHCHGSINYINNETTRLDMGVDCWDYYPITWDRIKEVLSQRTFKRVDHHGRSSSPELLPGESPEANPGDGNHSTEVPTRESEPECE